MDWFRRKTWTELDQQEFYARLKRSRSNFHKAQYLRIQAVTLKEAKSESLVRTALTLLDQLLNDYPEPSQIAPTCLCMGECYEALCFWDDAVSWYRKALEQQRIYPNCLTNAQLNFALLVAKRQRNSEYDEAISFLGEWPSLNTFPVMVFHECSARAMIHFDKREKAQACEWARRALEAAGRTNSGYRNHANLGLVAEKDRDLVNQIQEILRLTGD